MKAILLLAAFFAGSIPFGVIIAKLTKGIDPRSAGSGNIGATNVARVAGAKAGILTLIFDISKGAVPVLVARWLFPANHTFLIWCGLAAIVGHCLSPFLGFNGGKGVATGAGAFLAINHKAFLLALLVFAVVFAARRIVSLASITSAASMPLWMYLMEKDINPAAITALISCFIIYRHKDNIKRLLKGEEKPLKIGQS